MNKGWKFIFAALSFVSILSADNPQGGSNQTMQMSVECSNLPLEMQEFANKLSPSNKIMFCKRMSDGQRAMSMQMALQADSSGKPVMTPDQAVEKVGQNINTGATKSPSGCPVK